MSGLEWQCLYLHSTFCTVMQKESSSDKLKPVYELQIKAVFILFISAGCQSGSPGVNLPGSRVAVMLRLSCCGWVFVRPRAAATTTSPCTNTYTHHHFVWLTYICTQTKSQRDKRKELFLYRLLKIKRLLCILSIF